MATWNNNPGGAWSDSAQWTPNVVPNAVDAVADFNAVDGSSNGVALFGGPFTVGTLNLFNAVIGGFSFQNGTLVMQSSSGSAQINVETANNLQPDFFNNGTLQLNSNTVVNTIGSATFSSLSGISGTGGLEKTGTGTMTMGGVNTYAGPTFVLNGILNLQGTLASSTTISGGQMVLASGANIANSSSVTVSGLGTLTVNTFDTVASVFQMGGTIEGSFTLTTNTYTQFAGVLDGVLSASGTKTLNGGTILGTLQGAGATIIQTGTTTVTGTIAGDVSVATSGTLHIDGSTAVSGTITAQGSTISYADLASEDSEIILSATGTNFNVFGPDAATQSGVINESAAGMGLNKTGTGSLTLSGTNTYTGLTTVSAGTLIVTNATALGTTDAGTTVGNGATLAVQGGISVAEAITLNGTGVAGGGALRNLGGSPSNDVSGMITLATDARINSDANQLNIIGGITGTDTNLTVGGTAYTFIASAITTGTGSLTVDATTANGVVTLGGANTFTGGTTVNSGFLQLSGGSALADTGALTINSPGTVQVFSGETVGALSGSGTITLQTAGALVAGAATNTVFSGTIEEFAATGAFTKAGTGTLTLSGANTYTGLTTVNGGTLEVTGAVAGNVEVNGAGRLRIGNSTAIGGTITTTGSVVSYANGVNEASALILNSNTTQLEVLAADAATQSGIISETGGARPLEKIGTGMLTLTGANTYTGTTTVTAGTLTVSAGGALGASGAGNGTSVTSGATLALSGGITVAEAITLNGMGVSGGGALRAVAGLNIISGLITLATDARINTDADQMDITGGITGTDTNLTVGGFGNTNMVSNLDIGAGTLTKDGAGTLALGNANDFTGATTVNAGSLQVSATGALSDTGLLTVNATGFVQLFANETVGNIAGNGGIFLEAAGLTLTAGDATATSTFSGEIGQDGANAANFTKQGTGTLILSGVNTYTGITNIIGGTLALSGSGSLSNSSLIQLSAGTTFDISGTTTGATLIDLYSNGGVASLIMGGKSLTLTGVVGVLGALNVTGGAGTDALSITLASTLETFSLAGVTFANWTANVDTIRITGNALVNTITGNSDNNILDGGADTVVDTLIGDAGNDTYVLGAGSDIVNDTSGMDTIQSSISRNLAFYAAIENLTLTGAGNINGTGNALANRITGNSGNNILNGGTDSVVDTLIGGTGNDTYVLGAGSDAVIDASGVDTLTSSISRNLAFYAAIENLALTDTGNINGTGNALVNRIVGNIGNNILNGGTDSVVDTLIGGAGNDTYALGAGSDAVIDASGVDTLTSSISRNLAFYAAIENLALTETGNINGTGNALVNRIVGNVGNNILNGGTDSVVDTLIGGAGNDTYMLGDGSDAVNDTSGTDTIQSSISRNLAFYSTIENLVLTGTGNINGIGNALANRIVGNTGNNALNGGLGSDILTGGAGLDSFVFTTALSASNIDLITDYNVANDTIRIDNAVFAALGLGNLAATAFASNTTGLAGDATDRIIYESDTGRVFYDADGLGGAAGIHFATLTAGLALTQADFVVF